MTAAQSDGQTSYYARDKYERRICLRDKFDEKNADCLIGELRTFDSENCSPIVLDIDSNGGDYYPGKSLSSVIRGLASPVYGIVYGRCYSTAFHILQACEMRWALPNASFLFHNNSKIIHIRVTPDDDLQVFTNMLAQQIEKRKQVREEIITDLVGRLPHYSSEELRVVMKTGKIMSAEEALFRNFIDEILHI